MTEVFIGEDFPLELDEEIDQIEANPAQRGTHICRETKEQCMKSLENACVEDNLDPEEWNGSDKYGYWWRVANGWTLRVSRLEAKDEVSRDVSDMIMEPEEVFDI